MPEATKDAPAFDFYPERWIASTSHMKPADRDCYFLLLCHCWLRNGVPDNATTLKRMVGRTVPAEVLEKFPVDADGMRRNPTMEIIRHAQRERIQKSRDKIARMNAARGSCRGSTRDSTREEEMGSTRASTRPLLSASSPLTTHHSPLLERENAGARPVLNLQPILDTYVRRDAPMQCLQAIQGAIDRGATLEQILDGTRRAAQFLKGKENEKYTPNAITFFEQEKWRSPEAFERKAAEVGRTQLNSSSVQPMKATQL